MAKRDPRRTESLEKALDILETVGAEDGGIGLADLTRRLSKDKSTVWRILGTLVRRGYVEHDARTERYRLGIKLIELSARKMRGTDIVEVARPLVDELVGRCGETAQLAILSGKHVFYLYKKECYRSVAVRSEIGVRLSLHSTGSGKVLLANIAAPARAALLEGHEFRAFTDRTITNPTVFSDHLAGVRERGYSMDDEENEEGVRCIAAPIRDALGDTVAALSVAAPAARITFSNADALAREVVSTANAISERLGYLPAPAAATDSRIHQ